MSSNDDDYLGTTYIPHGKSTSDDNTSDEEDFLAQEESTPLLANENFDQTIPETAIRTIEERLAALESEHAAFMDAIEKRVAEVEKRAGMSPGERYLRIAEDA